MFVAVSVCAGGGLKDSEVVRMCSSKEAMRCGWLLSKTWKSAAVRPWTGLPWRSVTVTSARTMRDSAWRVSAGELAGGLLLTRLSAGAQSEGAEEKKAEKRSERACGHAVGNSLAAEVDGWA